MDDTAQSESPSPLSPATLGPLRLRNHIVKAATFEGATPKGEVTDRLVAFHRAVAEGGAAMSTVAYLAVSPEGRTDRHCLLATDATCDGLRRVTDAVHAAGAAASVQLGHAGPVANPRSNKMAALAPSSGFTPLGGRLKAMDDEALRRVVHDYRAAARRAVGAGFDAIELHLGHNYLLSAFLSPKLNRRRDRFGGSLENRARFPREVARAVREAAGDKVAVTAKFNMADGVPGGLWLDESVTVARWLQDDGALDALTLTGGSSLSNPMYLFRGEAPRREFAATLPAVARLGFKAVGRRFLVDYPYEEAFFLPYARQFRRTLELPLVLLGGISRLDTAQAALDEGFALVAMARALLRQPDLVEHWRRGDGEPSLCVHCNRCMPTIYSGTRCVLVDTEAPGR